jgi:uncharacterized protein
MIKANIRSLLIALLLVSTHLQAASFDCSVAFTSNEKLICSDNQLDKLDSRMGELYLEAKKIDSNWVRDNQRLFLNKYKNCKSVEQCKELVKSRNDDLSEYIYSCRKDNGSCRFSKKIISAVQRDDMNAFVKNINNFTDSRELEHGPSIQFLKKHKISDIFGKEWIEKVSSSLTGTELVSKGYMIANGEIWFNDFQNGWTITALNGLKEIKGNNINNTSLWKYKDKVLHPYCFVKDDGSSDIYQAYYEHFFNPHQDYFDSQEFQDFRTNIGKYWGKKIDSYKPIRAWDKDVEMAVSMTSCLNKKSKQLKIDESLISAVENESNDYNYQVIKEVPRKKCHELAPNIKGKCEASFLLEVSDWQGGSRGHDYDWIIFGLFKFENNEEYIFPLKRFQSVVDGENWISKK